MHGFYFRIQSWTFAGSLREHGFGLKRRIANLQNGNGDIVFFAGTKRRKKIDFGMANGRDVLFGLKVVRPSQSRGWNEVFENVMSEGQNIAKKENSRRIGLAKLDLNLFFELFCHFRPPEEGKLQQLPSKTLTWIKLSLTSRGKI